MTPSVNALFKHSQIFLIDQQVDLLTRVMNTCSVDKWTDVTRKWS